MPELNNARTIALLAHRAAVEEIAEIQQRLILAACDGAIGPRRLPFAPWRRRIHGTKLLHDAEQAAASEEQSDRERLDTLYSIAEQLETAFRTIREADDKAFAEVMAAYFRAKTEG